MDGYQREREREQITIFSCSPRAKGSTGSEPSETNRVVAKEGSVPAQLKTRGATGTKAIIVRRRRTDIADSCGPLEGLHRP